MVSLKLTIKIVDAIYYDAQDTKHKQLPEDIDEEGVRDNVLFFDVELKVLTAFVAEDLLLHKDECCNAILMAELLFTGANSYPL